jgi:hypothetical protein
MRELDRRPIAYFALIALFFGVVSPSTATAAADEQEVQMDHEMDHELLLNSLRGAEAVQERVASLSISSAKPCASLVDDQSGFKWTGTEHLPFVGKGALFLSRGGHAYAVFGGGRASDGGSLQNRALELEFGTNLSPRVRVDVAHINEGHPINNHRDGFALKGVYVVPVNEKARVEFGAGPYVSMDTTIPAGRTIKDQKDEKRLGAVATAAILYRITQGGLYARAQLNHVSMPGKVTTNAVMVGLGKDFNGPLLASDLASLESKPVQVAVWMGKTKTNRADAGGTLMGGQVEVSKETSPSMAYSVSWVDEGKGPMVNRNGVAAQVWYVTPAEESWKLKAGVGPYIAENRVPDDHRSSSNAMVSLVVERKIGKQDSISGRFNRVMSTNNRDQDMFMLGWKHDLK